MQTLTLNTKYDLDYYISENKKLWSDSNNILKESIQLRKEILLLTNRIIELEKNEHRAYTVKLHIAR
ncbi:MAG: hypothetical protein ACOYMA_18365 [Bacteroidia bacterium]